MSKTCRKCKTGTMTESSFSQDLTIRGVNLNVEGLLHWKCSECDAIVETPKQIDNNVAVISAALKTN